MSVADGENRKTVSPIHTSVLSPILFIIYTNDQPFHDGTRSFIYAHDICVTAQYTSLIEVERTIGDALDKLT